MTRDTPIPAYAECVSCEKRPHGPVGVTCACGRHFHVGSELMVRTDPCIECPSCERRFTPLEIADA